MIVLPEMFATGFSMNAGEIAEPLNGETVCFLRELARELGVYVLGGAVRRDSGARMFNEAICISPSGRCVARYAKLHLFTPGSESQHYTRGGNLALFRWGNLKVAVGICYDLRFPEMFRMGAQHGAEVFVVIANWPSLRRSHWTALLRARAIENQAYVIGVNRCGHDPKLSYDGRSMILGPKGETLASAGRKETLISAGLNHADLVKWRHEFPALQDIRTQFTLEP